MNFLELVQGVYSGLAEPNITSFNDIDPTEGRWTQTLIKSRVNAIHREICAKTRCLVTTGSQDTVASQWEYAFPTDCQEIIEAAYYNGSTYTVLENVTLPFLARYSSGNSIDWRTTFGTPERWFYSLRTGYLGLYPGTDTAVTSGLNLLYVQIPALMTAAADTPFGATNRFDGFHKVIIDGVMAWCLKDEGSKDYGTAESDYQRGMLEIRRLVEMPSGNQSAFYTTNNY